MANEKQLNIVELRQWMFIKPELQEMCAYFGTSEDAIKLLIMREENGITWEQFKDRQFLPIKAKLIKLLLEKSESDFNALKFALQWLCGMRPKEEGFIEAKDKSGNVLKLKYSVDIPDDDEEKEQIKTVNQ